MYELQRISVFHKHFEIALPTKDVPVAFHDDHRRMELK